MSIDDDEPIWLTTPQVIALNRVSVSKGENHYLRSLLSLEGALSRPWTLYAYEGETDLYVLAARLASSVANAHAFEQGNKRTAFQSAMVFLMTNGTPVEPLDMVEFAQLIEALTLRDPLAEATLATAFREYAVPLKL